MNKKINVKCFRLDPLVDEDPEYQVYEVPLEPQMSVTDVLDYIYENLDSTLAYFKCCCRGLCGRCTVKVNGKPALACLHRVKGDITLEPISKEQVVRDLVVENL
jgi:succinate dehydrogenase/fumarate reductase iron-sulfur protein